MLTAVRQFPSMSRGRMFGPARVVGGAEEEGAVLLEVEAPEGRFESLARWAVPCPHGISPGDTVLVAGEETKDLYVIGVLDRVHPPLPAGRKLVLENGARAEIDASAEGERLTVRSPSGELLLEYDPKAGKTRVHVPTGDLEFVARDGDIRFASGRDIRFAGRRSVELGSLGELRMGAPEIEVVARSGEIRIEEARYTGKRFQGAVGQVRLVLGRMETVARDVVEKARNVYRTAEGLFQTRAGRMRTLVGTTLQMKAGKAFLKSEEEFKVRAGKIHLG